MAMVALLVLQTCAAAFKGTISTSWHNTYLVCLECGIADQPAAAPVMWMQKRHVFGILAANTLRAEIACSASDLVNISVSVWC
jgi:hypothetical protein